MNRPTRNALFGCLIVTGLLVGSAQAERDFGSGNYMLPHCEHYMRDNYSYDVWDGDCGGTISTLTFLGQVLPDMLRFCKPKGATQGQSGRIVLNFLKAHPERLHEPFVALAGIALHEAWPCK